MNNQLPVAAAFLGLLSVQIGAAIAKTLFPIIGTEGIAALRLGITAILLTLLTRPWRLWASQPSWRALFGYGITMGMMNLLIYRAFSYIHVSIAVSVEVLGPLAIALFYSRQRLDFFWVALALLGVALLPFGNMHDNFAWQGLLYSLGAAACWGAYIFFGGKVANGGSRSVATGMLIASLFALPLGAHQAGTLLLAPHILMIGFCVSLLSSTIPYLLDMFAMKHLSPKIFGVLLSASPAASAVAAWLILDEKLALPQVMGIFAIMLACSGSACFSKR
jgi:inner membrane transporter RhtA